MQEIVNVKPPEGLEKGRGRWRKVLKYAAIGVGAGLLVGSSLAIAAGGLIGGALGL